MQNQQELWDKIAPEWHKYKQKPSRNALDFLKRCSGNVLDLGSGSGRHLTKVKNGKMFLQDISKKMLKLAKEKAKEKGINTELIHSTLEKIPKENEFFDYAICISALHCVKGNKERKKTIEELFRVLKKRGKTYIGVWNEDSKRFKNKKGKTKELSIGWGGKGKRYYYLYNEKEIHNLFESIGFKILSKHSSEMMVNFIAQKI